MKRAWEYSTSLSHPADSPGLLLFIVNSSPLAVVGGGDTGVNKYPPNKLWFYQTGDCLTYENRPQPATWGNWCTFQHFLTELKCKLI